MMDRRTFIKATSALTIPATLSPRIAQSGPGYPTRAVRVISPYAAGGGPDVQLRQAGPALSDTLRQSVVIENRVGAGGVLAAQHVATQTPDGYTLLLGSNTHLLQKILQPHLSFDPINDFAPISSLMTSPTILVVAADSPYQDIDALVQAAQKNTGTMNYGSGGIGTSAHLAGATFVSLAKLDVVHIPLKGSVEIPAALLRRDLQFAFPVAGTAMPQIQGGKLRALAVTSRQRLAQLPDVPTLHEYLKDDLAVQESWFSIWAPKGTSPEVQQVIHAAVTQVVGQAKLKDAYRAAGNEAVSCASPAAFAAFVRDENRKWQDIVSLTGVTINS